MPKPKPLVAPLVAAALLVTGGLSLTSAQGRTLKDRFVGTWRLVNIETRNAKGEIVGPANPNANQNRTGYIIFDDAGYMAVTIMPLGRKKAAGAQITDEEAQAALAGYAAYFGTFTFNEKEQSVTYHVEGSVDPALGRDQKRFFEMSGNRLTLKPPPGPSGNQQRIIWERMPDLTNPTAEQKKFVGFWKLVGTERRTEGETASANPGQTGYIIYTAAGFMTVHMVQPDRKPYAAAQPTPQEARQNLRTYTNYFGPFYVHDVDGYVVHDQFGSLGVGRNGYSPQQRFYRFVGNRLLLQPPPTYNADGTVTRSTITWEKVGRAAGTP
jgi:hypothetical protein